MSSTLRNSIDELDPIYHFIKLESLDPWTADDDSELLQDAAGAVSTNGTAELKVTKDEYMEPLSEPGVETEDLKMDEEEAMAAVDEFTAAVQGSGEVYCSNNSK